MDRYQLMEKELSETVREAVAAAFAGPEGPAAGLAVSGGLDSMALLEAAAELALEGLAPRLCALHVDHGLRSDSADDARLVREAVLLWRSRGVRLEFEILRIEGLADEQARAGGSLAARARRHRYRRLAAACRRRGLGTLLMAHHRDDLVETLAWRTLRGTAAPGIRGIPEERLLRRGQDTLLRRPLLRLHRSEIESWARRRGLVWKEDPGNRDLTRTRNRLRHAVLPLAGPDVAQRLLSLEGRVGSLERTARALGARIGARVVRQARWEIALGRRTQVLDRQAFLELPSPVARAVLEDRLEALVPARLEALMAALRGAGDGLVSVAPHLQVLRDSETLQIIDRSPELPASRWVEFALSGGERREIDGTGLSIALAASTTAETQTDGDERLQPIPSRLLRRGLRVRRPERGERMRPFGSRNSASLFDLLAAAGIPAPLRPHWPVVVDRQGALWVAGVRAAERCRVSPGENAAILRLEGPWPVREFDDRGEEEPPERRADRRP